MINPFKLVGILLVLTILYYYYERGWCQTTWQIQVNPARDTAVVCKVCPGPLGVATFVRVRITGSLDDSAAVGLRGGKQTIVDHWGGTAIGGDRVRVLTPWMDLYTDSFTVFYLHNKAKTGKLMIQAELPNEYRPVSNDSATVK